MLLSEMKIALMRYGFDSTDPLTIWLNWGMREFERAYDWPFLENFQTVPTIIGTPEYTISTSILRQFKSLKINGDAKPLERMSLAQFHFEVPDKLVTGHPYKYVALTANTFRLYYIPDAVYTVDIYARGYELDLVDGNPNDTFDLIPPALHHLPVLRAAVFALETDNEESRASTLLNEFNTAVANAIADLGEHGTGPEYVQDVMSGGTWH